MKIYLILSSVEVREPLESKVNCFISSAVCPFHVLMKDVSPDRAFAFPTAWRFFFIPRYGKADSRDMQNLGLVAAASYSLSSFKHVLLRMYSSSSRAYSFRENDVFRFMS